MSQKQIANMVYASQDVYVFNVFQVLQWHWWTKW